MSTKASFRAPLILWTFLLLFVVVRAVHGYGHCDNDACAANETAVIVACDEGQDHVDVDVTLGSVFKLAPWSSRFCNVKLHVAVNTPMYITCNLEGHYCAEEQYFYINWGKGPNMYCTQGNPQTFGDAYNIHKFVAWDRDLKFGAVGFEYSIRAAFYYPTNNRSSGEEGRDHCTITSPNFADGELDAGCGKAPDVTLRSAAAPAAPAPGAINEPLNVEEDNAESRIIGGAGGGVEKAHPWMGYIHSSLVTEAGVLTKKTCAATLIKDNWAMTIAECFNMDPSIHTVATRAADVCFGPKGQPKLLKTRVCDVEVHTTDIFVHEGFDYDVNLHNIALVKLPSPVTFSEFVRPVCLAPMKPNPITYQVAVGWGRVDNKLSTTAFILTQGTSQVIDEIHCMEDARFNINCVYPWRSEGNPCLGDYGGFVGEIDPYSGKGVQYGIASHGSRNHPDNPFDPRVYCDVPVTNTDVSSYLQWIKDVIANNA